MTPREFGSPFLGLHYFDEKDAPLFFGRDDQVAEILGKIASTRFVAVVGASGSGKSSLVHAGVVPALRAGFLTSATGSWQIVKTRPGNAPISLLAAQIESALSVSGAETTLLRGPLGIVDAVRSPESSPSASVLVFVDQFEEIFRFIRETGGSAAAVDEAAAFVKLLLAAVEQKDVPIYVLITMRSEYLGQCAQFRDLPEQINSGLYLVPRMRRDQLEEAIAGPAAVAGGQFSTALVQRLLNDAGDDPDQLPVLQHALRRTWACWTGEPQLAAHIDFPHYDAAGGMRDGLHKHAEEIFGRLSAEEQRITQATFRCLTELDPANNAIRRPTALGVVARIARCSVDTLVRALQTFLSDDAAFLTLLTPGPPQESSILDLTHESLIQRWHRLGGDRGRGGWLQAEAALRDQYIELSTRAVRAVRSGDTLSRNELPAALVWQKMNLALDWAVRYVRAPEAYEQVQAYIQRSLVAQRRRQVFSGALGVIGLGATVLILGLGIALLKGQAVNRRLVELERLATARKLASDAEALRDRDSRIEVRTLLAIESLKHHDLPEGNAAIREPIKLLVQPLWTYTKESAPSDPGLVFDPESRRGLLYSKDGKYLIALMAGGLRVFHADYGQAVNVPSVGEVVSVGLRGTTVYVLVAPVADVAKSPHRVLKFEVGSSTAEEVFQTVCPNECLLTGDGTLLVANDSDAHKSILLPVEGRGTKTTISADTVLTASGSSGGVVIALRDEHIEISGRGRHIRETAGENERSLGSTWTAALSSSAKHGVVAWQTQRQRDIFVFGTEPTVKRIAEIRMEGAPAEIAVSDDGTRIVLGDAQGGIRVVDVETKAVLNVWTHVDRIVAIAASPDGHQIATMDASGALRATQLPGLPASFQRHGGLPGLSFDSGGYHLLVREPGRVRVIDVATGVEKELEAPIGTLASALDQASDSVAFLDQAGNLHVVRLTDRRFKTLKTLSNVSRSGRPAIAVSGYMGEVALLRDGRVRVFDANTGAERKLPLPLLSEDFKSPLLFSLDGRFAALGRRSTNAAVLVRCDTWTVVGEWPIHGEGVLLSFSPDGKFLLARARRGVPRSESEDVESGAPELLLIDTALGGARNLGLSGTYASRFSPDGRWLAVATGDRDHLVHLVSLPDATVVARWPMDADTSPLAFNDASNQLALLDRGDAVHVHAVPGGAELSRLPLFGTTIYAARFSDADRKLVVVMKPDLESTDLQIIQHFLRSSDLISEACRLVSRNMRRKAEWSRYLPEQTYAPTCPKVEIPME